MPRPTLDELYARLGTQPASYSDDYCAERQGYPATCGNCGKLVVLDRKPARRQLAAVRCGECAQLVPPEGAR